MKVEQKINTDVVVIGAGAAGFFAAIEAAKRGREVYLLDHARKIGEKIRISGGGRCNFTNINANSSNYISENPHFVKSALARYTAQDFIHLVEKYGIAYHEKKLGQLFCDNSSQEIIDMLISEAKHYGVKLYNNCQIDSVTAFQGAKPSDDSHEVKKFQIETSQGIFRTEALLIATGGLSIPQIGATNFGYNIAKQFGLKITERRPALVPLVLSKKDLARLSTLTGVAIDSEVTCNGTCFRENILVTHHGLSGPAILQISSYWQEGKEIEINLLPEHDLSKILLTLKQENSKLEIQTILKQYLPTKFIEMWMQYFYPEIITNTKKLKIVELGNKDLEAIAKALQGWKLKPIGTEGYAKAEVTVGGVSTDELSSKTMESKKIPGLYFIGEVVDVTGWLGGYNFQWAWASAFAAGQNC